MRGVGEGVEGHVFQRERRITGKQEQEDITRNKTLYFPPLIEGGKTIPLLRECPARLK